jgi:hypothetical protein
MRRSFAIDWKHGISDIIQNRCASCHAEGASAQQQTGLRLDGDVRTWNLITKNEYTREDGTVIRGPARYACCTLSRWFSINSARSSMLVWALYGERMDGRDPNTGLPPANSGVPVDGEGLEHPETWPNVASHLAHVSSMPESEKRLITRWIDIGAPLDNVHDDKDRPVLTVTPIMQNNAINKLFIGLWDDSPLDYTSFSVTENGTDITPDVSNKPVIVVVNLTTPITDANADSFEYTFEIWDSPNRSLSMIQPETAAANRVRKTYTGRGLIRLANSSGGVIPDPDPIPPTSPPPVVPSDGGGDTGGGDTGGGDTGSGSTGGSSTGGSDTTDSGGGVFGIEFILLVLIMETLRRRRATIETDEVSK